ncbi:hypothetical protein [Enemella evansiae]|uniref:hypothetical protein n=1 Tax=Enemella evansiae TaxID=2016499 RepID=UPI0010F1ECF3|nr:hypothetical protein [Enemella evansiae]TDO92593.1 hypothetical protein C8D81_0352 [Enemella evansiae]
MTQEPEQRPTPEPESEPEEEFKLIDFGRILRYMGLALLAMAVLGGLIVAVAYLLVK